jgi:hypothetical protein
VPSVGRIVQIPVAGTPNPIEYNLEAEESMYNLDKQSSRLRYPFEITCTGTQPKIGAPDVYSRTIGAGHAHSNGGGFVENSATVASTAYVGPNARVLGSANVSGYARIEGHATVIDSRIYDNAIISGRAFVSGGSSDIRGRARVRDRSYVQGAADMQDNALLSDHAKWISGRLQGNATCRGQAWTYGNPTVGGHAILDGEYVREWPFTDGVHKGHYPWDGYLYHYDDFSAKLIKPVGLMARYQVEEADGDILQDTFGALHALLRGSPVRAYDSTMCANVLQLNGSDQHVLLDQSIGDSQAMSFSGWCKLESRTAGAALLSLGHRSDEYIRLVPSNASDLVELAVRKRTGESVTLTGSTSLPVDTWVHLAFTIDGSAIKLYVNGQQVDSDTLAFYPYEMITPDLQETGQANYVGRDWSGNYLAARLSDLQFYNTAMTGTQVTDEYNKYGRMLARFYKDTTYTSGALENTGV